MEETLVKYIPERAVKSIIEHIKKYKIYLKIVPKRSTKHGDYRRMPNGQHQITVNGSENKYQFLLTLVHEIAHLVAFEQFGRHIKPHGNEWKHSFQELLIPFLNASVFPEKLLPYLVNYIKNPKASSGTDAALAVALSNYNENQDHFHYVFEIPEGSTFRTENGRLFKKGKIRRKRYECLEINGGRTYVFSPNARVELIN
jgi:hypothetical protein